MSAHLDTETLTLTIDDKALEVVHHRHPQAVGTILLLHEALGSISYWKRFPQQLALAASSNVLLYSRAGHGNSQGPLSPRTGVSYRHEVETVIPYVLDQFRIERPILYGHSEGAGLAILYASTTKDVNALVLESPFIVAHSDAGEMIRRMEQAYPGSHLQRRLSDYHRDADAVFYSWTRWAGSLADGAAPLAEYLAAVIVPGSGSPRLRRSLWYFRAFRTHSGLAALY